jgi:membrane-bound lytic murein transglycosylase D
MRIKAAQRNILTLRFRLSSIAAMLLGIKRQSATLAGLLVVCLGACTWPSRPVDPTVSKVKAATMQPAAIIEANVAATASATTTSEINDLWRKIGIELRMAASPAHRASDPLELFGNSGAMISRASERARPFLNHIYHEVEKRQLPLEIALIPIIESAYNPAATSPAGAAGIWQFMPATAHRFGLHQSRWYDGRRDLIASTAAALDYFEALRDRFMGDWELVFAAYNCGERTVERAIERNARLGLATDFHALELPRATRDYVPRLLALVEIIAHPQAHAVELAAIPSADYFEIVDVGGVLDLNRVIAWSAMSGAEFDHLNAAFRKRYSVTGAPTLVLVPSDRSGAVKAALEAMPDSDRRMPREHIVSAGETLSHIASATGVPVNVIKQANQLRSNRLAIGQKLVVPDPGKIHALADRHRHDSMLANAPYVVQDGDNLWDLARRYDTTVARIANVNNIRQGATLRLGQKLKIPADSVPQVRVQSAPSVPAVGQHYEVRNGDSLWTISRRFKVSIAELKRWNDLDGRYLQPGQRLVVGHPQGADGNQDI